MPQPAPYVFDRSAGHLALDFANTVSGRLTDAPIERLASYGDLVEFARQAAVLDEARADALRTWAAAHPVEAEAIRRRATRLRDALYALFRATPDGAAPSEADLAALAAEQARLRVGPRFAWEWADGAEAPDAVLGPIVVAAVELLTSPRRERVHRCGADDCAWIFLDESKNQSRRWCDMKSCGNRMKARRYAERHRHEPG